MNSDRSDRRHDTEIQNTHIKILNTTSTINGESCVSSEFK